MNQTVLAGTSYGTHEGSSRFERETLEKQVLHQLILERAAVPPAAVDQVVQTARQFHDLVLGAESLESEARIGMATKLSQHIKSCAIKRKERLPVQILELRMVNVKCYDDVTYTFNRN